MKILFADAVGRSRIAALESAGHRCRVEPDLTADDLPTAVADTEILVVRSTKVSAETISAGRDLSLVVRAGAGTDNIDTAAAADAGVYVCNVPGRNAIAVAELTMGLLLAIDRHIADATADLRSGRWNKGRYSASNGLAGRTLAIIGLGDIGLAVAERAKAFGMIVQAERRAGRSEAVLARIRSIGVRMVESQAELLADADIVSIHVPAAPSTVGLVDTDFIAALPDGCVILNTSRGDVLDEAALLRGLEQRGMRAGLDVFIGEPEAAEAEFSSPLASHPSVVGTHHIGASTRQAQEAVADGVIEVIEAFAKGKIVNCVNLVPEGAVSNHVVVRHLDRVGVLATVLHVLSSRGHNVEQMQNQQFDGGDAAVASIGLDRAPEPDTLDALVEIPDVLGVAVNGSAA